MFAWIARWYAKRIINVNCNIIVAGVLAMAVTVAFMHYFVDFGLDQKTARLTHLPHDAVIGGVTFLVDLIADLAVYYVLHWLANHMPRRAGKILDQLNPAYAHLSFMQDATLVQVERMALSPVFYVVALGGQYVLHRHMQFNIRASTSLAFGAAIVLTRCMHTLWMLYRERRAMVRLRTAAAANAPAKAGDGSLVASDAGAREEPASIGAGEGTSDGNGENGAGEAEGSMPRPTATTRP